MTNIIWILWALKIAGLTSVTYKVICIISIGIILARGLLEQVYKLLTIRQSFKALEKLDDELDKDGKYDKTNHIMGILMLIYAKLK